MKMGGIEKVAVLGGGLIGSSWATNFLWKGLRVSLYDINEQALSTAESRIRQNLEYLVSKTILTRDEMNSALGLVTYHRTIEEAVAGVRFIQESVPENYEVKQSVLAEVDEYAPADGIFASSTSGLLLSEIAKNSKRPDRCIGAHPYNPAHLIPLVEISKGEKTDEAAVTRACDFYRALGKEPIVLRKEALGFIANRLSMALYREAVDLVVRGVCSVEDVDKAVNFGPGLRYALMGPNLIYQLGGGQHGIEGLLKHVGGSVELWWQDMATWKKWPPAWTETARDGSIGKWLLARPTRGAPPKRLPGGGMTALSKSLSY